MLNWPMSSPQMMTMFGLAFVYARAGATLKSVAADSMPPTNAHDAILAGAPLTGSLTTLSFRSKALTIRRAVLRFMTTCLSRKMSNLLFI